MSDCRIILVDDHTLFRGGLRGLLDRYEGFRVVGAVSYTHLTLPMKLEV